MRVTILGATGLLGKALMRQWTEDEITALGSADADIRDPQQVSDAVNKSRPEWIISAAAYTDVDGCETHRARAFDVNCRGAANVANAAKQYGARLLHLSTDYVFDGTRTSPYETSDPRSPRSVYGESKAQAEIELEKLLPEVCIVRTSWLFGVGGKCFPDTILKLAATKPTIDVVTDQVGAPTYTVDLANAIIQLCRRGARGIVHATNQGQCSWFDFAREIVSAAGGTAVVRPTTTDKFARPAERPKYSVLSPASLESYRLQMPHWKTALQAYLNARSISE